MDLDNLPTGDSNSVSDTRTATNQTKEKKILNVYAQNTTMKH